MSSPLSVLETPYPCLGSSHALPHSYIYPTGSQFLTTCGGAQKLLVMWNCQLLFFLTLSIHSCISFRITDITDKHWQALESNMVEDEPEIVSDKKKRYDGQASTFGKIGNESSILAAKLNCLSRV